MPLYQAIVSVNETMFNTDEEMKSYVYDYLAHSFYPQIIKHMKVNFTRDYSRPYAQLDARASIEIAEKGTLIINKISKTFVVDDIPEPTVNKKELVAKIFKILESEKGQWISPQKLEKILQELRELVQEGV